MPVRMSAKKFIRMKDKRLSEYDIQRQFIDYMDYKYPFFSKCLIFTHNESIYNRKDLRQLGVRPGTPDIFFMASNGDLNGLWIEFKAGSNKLTPEQEDFEGIAAVMGYGFIVCRSCDEAVAAIKNYLKDDMILSIPSEALE